MTVNEANNILQNCKLSMQLAGYPIAQNIEIDALLYLLDRLDINECLAKLKKEEHEKPVLEKNIVFFRLVALEKHPLDMDFGLNYYKEINRRLFEGISTDAGNFRNNNVKYKSGEYTHYTHITKNSRTIFAMLKKEGFLRGLNKEDFAVRLTYFLHEFNILHPFVIGCGRTRRYFFRQLSRQAGYNFDFTKIIVQDYKHALGEAFLTDDILPFFKSVYKCLSFAAPRRLKAKNAADIFPAKFLARD